MTIELPLWYVSYWVTFEATLLPNIAPHLANENTFALVKKTSGQWCVTHVETGCAVTSADRAFRAIRQARTVLARHTLATHRQVVAKLPLECRV
jgi:hypothetical protein